jgi:hypothetical protein
MGRLPLTLPAKPPQRLITVVHYPYAPRAGCSALCRGMNFIGCSQNECDRRSQFFFRDTRNVPVIRNRAATERRAVAGDEQGQRRVVVALMPLIDPSEAERRMDALRRAAPLQPRIENVGGVTRAGALPPDATHLGYSGRRPNGRCSPKAEWRLPGALLVKSDTVSARHCGCYRPKAGIPRKITI